MTIFRAQAVWLIICKRISVQRESEYFKFTQGVILYPLGIALLMWIVLWSELRLGVNFTTLGVKPREFTGLIGVICSPFIHSGMSHLWHNTIPIIVLTAALFYFYKPIAFKVLLLLYLGAGLGTWLIGRTSYHIGMSGVIYALVAFLFFKGIMTKHYRLVALSLLVVFLYGSLIWGTLPIKAGVSWEGHLSGFVVGILVALRFRESVPTPPQFVWEKDDYNDEDDVFMQHFDADGNFVPSKPEETDMGIATPDDNTTQTSEIEGSRVVYHFKRKDEEE